MNETVESRPAVAPTLGERPVRRGRFRRILRRTAVAAAVGVVIYVLFIRPWHLRWGATEAEAAAALPGDHLVPLAAMATTRAVTIDAPVADVWPWLVQMGQGRGGLYSYDWLENIVGCDIHSVDSIVPTLQTLRVGDTIRLGPEGYPFNIVRGIDSARSLVLYGGAPDGDSLTGVGMSSSWVFILERSDSAHTRLLARFRADWPSGFLNWLGFRGALEPAHFIMERKMLLGIKERVEAAHARGSASSASMP